MLTILDKYIVREVFWSTLGVILVLLVILLGNTIMRILGKIVEGSLPSSALIPLIAVNMVHYTTILLPLSIYLGVLLAMGRFYKDSEISALSACGVGTFQLYRPIFYVLIPTILLSTMLSLYGAPWVSELRQSIKHQAEQRSELSSVVAGRFNEAQAGDSTLFVESLSDDRRFMENVFLKTKSIIGGEEATVVETAETGYQYKSEPADKRFMILNNGHIHSFIGDDRQMRYVEFKEHGIELREKDVSAPNLKISAAKTSDLWGGTQAKEVAELQWRLSVPVACLLLALLALPLSYTTPRKGRYSKLATGILVYLIYTNMLGIARGLIEKGQVPSYIGMVWPHLVLLVIILILLRYQMIMLASDKWRMFWQRQVSIAR